MRSSRLALVCMTAILASVLIFSTGCRGKKVSWSSPWGKKSNGDSIPLPPNEGYGDTSSDLAGGFELPSVDPEQLPPLEQIEKQGIALAAAPREAATVISAMQPIFFGYDSAEIDDDARVVLDADARWLQDNPSQKVQVEGHCDDRGTSEYNYALGQRRAEKVREYLASKGIHPSRLFPISYGEDRPLEQGAVAKNRRVQFLAYD